MAVREERTGFEWLDTPFLITRTLIPFLGGWCCILLFAASVSAAGLVLRQLKPAPPPAVEPEGEGEAEVHTRTDCFGETGPFQDLMRTFWISAVPIAAMILGWTPPKPGFLLIAVWWVIVGPLAFWARSETCEDGLPAQRFFIALIVPVPLWLCFAAQRIGPSRRPRTVSSRAHDQRREDS